MSLWSGFGPWGGIACPVHNAIGSHPGDCDCSMEPPPGTVLLLFQKVSKAECTLGGSTSFGNYSIRRLCATQRSSSGCRGLEKRVDILNRGSLLHRSLMPLNALLNKWPKNEALQVWVLFLFYFVFAKYYYFILDCKCFSSVIVKFTALLTHQHVTQRIQMCSEPQFQLNGPGFHRCAVKERICIYCQQLTVTWNNIE